MTTAPPIPEAEYTILGSVSVRRGQDAAPALGQQTRLLLARLLRDPGAMVTVDALIMALWGEEPSDARRGGLHQAVRAARRLLGDVVKPHSVVVVDGDTYRLVVQNPLSIDAERFRRLSQRGHQLIGARPRTARAMLAEALSTWQGPLFGDAIGELPWAAGHAAELARMRDRAQIDLNEVRLALGEGAALEATLRHQIELRPEDERLRAQLIRALLGDGRATEALIAFRAALGDLGGAGPELMALGRQAGRGRLDAPPRASETRRSAAGGDVVLCAALDLMDGDRAAPGIGTVCLVLDGFGGIVRPGAGEQLLATFEDPDHALRAARAIASDRRLAVRVGVHAGAIIDLGDELIGSGPDRCRQLMAAAHPGQVLVSGALRDLAGHVDELRDLGEHRFADLGQPARLFELAHPGGVEFPAPVTLQLRPHNLPVQPTRFIGRADELAALSQRVTAGAVITLTGPGGGGKTRLGLQLAARNLSSFAHGAWFVGLAELEVGAEVEQVAGAIVNQVGVRALPDETLPAAVIRHLSDRSALLILDNCEQVIEACASLLAELHLRCPEVCVVVTSRRPLGIDAESAVAVRPMATDAWRPGALSDAVELLLERAGPMPGDLRELTEAMAHAERICRAFDGLPLAIELAAGQVPTRTLAIVAAEVAAMVTGERRWRYASTDPLRPQRHRTMEAAIAWSYDLLDERERCVLRRLAVCRGSFGETDACRLGAGEECTVGEVAGILANLIDCSVAAADPPLNDALRMRLLEPIRTFASDRLAERGELQSARAAHAAVYLDLGKRTAPGLFDHREQICLELLEADHDNLIAALTWYVNGGRSREALELVGALWWLWFSHGHLEEGCGWVKRVLELDEEPSQARVRALRVGSHLSWWQGDFNACAKYNAELAACAEAIDDDWGRAWAPMAFGAVEMFHQPASALERFADSKARFERLGRRWEAGYTLMVSGGARWFGGDARAAGEAYDEAVDVFEALDHRSVLASARRGAGLMAARCGRPVVGELMCLEALRLSNAIGDRAGSAQALNFAAAISRDSGDHATALQRYGDALSLAREVGELWATCWALDGLGGIARTVGEPEIAARLLAHSGRLASRAGYRPPPHELTLRCADLTALRLELGEDRFEQTIAEGGVMGAEAAVTCAVAFASRHL
jgi:predicted ATPase/DNA-binding SARP family transcriptional activator